MHDRARRTTRHANLTDGTNIAKNRTEYHTGATRTRKNIQPPNNEQGVGATINRVRASGTNSRTARPIARVRRKLQRVARSSRIAVFVAGAEARGQQRRPDSNRPPAPRGQSPRGAAVAHVTRPPIVRDVAREARRDVVPRRGNWAVRTTPRRRGGPWAAEARGWRSGSQPRSGVA